MSETGASEFTAPANRRAASVARTRHGRSIASFIAIFQTLLLLVHAAVYATWAFFYGSSATLALPITFAILSVSFVPATLLAHRYFNAIVRVIYTLAAIWLGILNFLFLAACACWIVYGVPLAFGIHLEKHIVAAACFGLGLVAAVVSVVNAAWPRVVRIKVSLPNLPASWRGRTAAIMSDLHLGHIRNAGFLRRIAQKLADTQPDVLFLPGDMFDGSDLDFERIAKPLSTLSAPLGAYFVMGNHEQFRGALQTQYLDAVRRAGIHVLDNEKILLDGLQVVGVHDGDAGNVEHFRSILRKAAIDPNAASVLLVHNPNRLPIAAEAGISLQVSGHTHLGQFYPFTAIVRRIYGPFAHGLNLFGDLAVYTSSGVGSWGPPMRLGSNPEIVLIQFA